MKALVIEDDKNICDFLSKGFNYKNGFCDFVFTGKEGLEILSRKNYDIVIVDLVLPDLDGADIIKRMREKGITIPIIVLTALQGANKKVELLNLGADDYMTKPFSFEELFARISSILRRKKNSHPTEYLKAGDLELDPEKRIARRAGKEISLRRKEYALLEYFLRHKNKVVSRENLMRDVWGYSTASTSSTVDSHVSVLRRKIDSGFKKKLIKTIHRVGYILEAED